MVIITYFFVSLLFPRREKAARSGNAISFAFFAWLLQWATSGVTAQTPNAIDSSWRLVFRASGVIQLLPLMMLTYFGRKGARPEDLTIPNRSSLVETKKQQTLKDSLAILFQQSRTIEFWLHLISRSVIMVLVSFLLFIPSYMTQCFEMSSASSARVGSMFALGCLLSVSSLAEKSYPSVHTANSNTRAAKPTSIYRRKAYSMLAFLAAATGCLASQTAFLHNLISLSPRMGTIMMFLFGFSLGKKLAKVMNILFAIILTSVLCML